MFAIIKNPVELKLTRGKKRFFQALLLYAFSEIHSVDGKNVSP